MSILNGKIFKCTKSCKRVNAVKGLFYVYEDGTLKTLNKRFVNIYFNGHEMLHAGNMEPAKVCPFCGEQGIDFASNHDGLRCASLWDARNKNYCPDCNADLKFGFCVKCGKAIPCAVEGEGKGWK